MHEQTGAAPPLEHRYKTAEEVAEALQVSPLTVKRWARRGELKSYRVGDRAGGYRFLMSDVDAFMERRRTAGEKVGA